ncbi:MAG: preprotein translocase subunit YajC [Syntrophus sp. (in: bacteria)]|nr:preprotein translocase subunit YajC [Syntrophus sp. (in: bacteria)]
MFADIAHAMGNFGGGGAGGGGDFSFIIMMMVIFAIFYFLLIMPQQKKQKEMKKMLAELAHGDMVQTVGGIQGRITSMTEAVITIEIAEKVKIKVARNFIGAVIEKAPKP